MNDLMQYIDKDLMIAAAKNMAERSGNIDEPRVDMYNPMTYESAFGGDGGSVDYPTSYTTGGVYSEGFWWWSDDTVYMKSESFDAGSAAPWASDLYSKWDAMVLSRGSEAFAIQEELSTLKRCVMQYLADTGEVDLEHAGLIEDAGS